MGQNKTYSPYIEIVKKKDIKGNQRLVATLHIEGDFWVPMEYTMMKSKSDVAFNTKIGFLNRIRNFGRSLGIDVEENF